MRIQNDKKECIAAESFTLDASQCQKEKKKKRKKRKKKEKKGKKKTQAVAFIRKTSPTK